MATFAILITDLEDDGVEVNTRSDIELAEDTELTPALMLGLAATAFLQESMTLDEEQSEKPSLEVVGDAD
jgi:hypothetical protein